MKRLWVLLRRWAALYTDKRLTRASAALSFFLTSTLFPLLIILYTLLGSSPERIERIMAFARQLMAAETADTIGEFLTYVARNNSRSMMMAALILLLTSASAAMRTLQATIGELQGEPRFRGLTDFLFSLIFSLLFTAALYFAILVMLTGREFLAWFKGIFPVFDSAGVWQVLRYPLVYGSLASVILLMLWLYTCCLMIFSGAALNVALRDQRREEKQRRFAPQDGQ